MGLLGSGLSVIYDAAGIDKDEPQAFKLLCERLQARRAVVERGAVYVERPYGDGTEGVH